MTTTINSPITHDNVHGLNRLVGLDRRSIWTESARLSSSILQIRFSLVPTSFRRCSSTLSSSLFQLVLALTVEVIEARFPAFVDNVGFQDLMDFNKDSLKVQRAVDGIEDAALFREGEFDLDLEDIMVMEAIWLSIQRIETKWIIEQLIMQKTFSREECYRLTELLKSRVIY